MEHSLLGRIVTNSPQCSPQIPCVSSSYFPVIGLENLQTLFFFIFSVENCLQNIFFPVRKFVFTRLIILTRRHLKMAMRNVRKNHGNSKFSGEIAMFFLAGSFGKFIWEPNCNRKTPLQRNLPRYDAALSAMFFLPDFQCIVFETLFP